MLASLVIHSFVRSFAVRVAVCAAAAALAYAVRVYSKKSSLPYPPGPQGYPFIGNLGFPEDPALWKKVRAMSEEYGADSSWSLRNNFG